MVDLTFVPFEEIQAELARRYPAFLLAVSFIPEGQSRYGERVSWGGTLTSAVACLGLARLSAMQTEAALMNTTQHLPYGNFPLDPPSPGQKQQ